MTSSERKRHSAAMLLWTGVIVMTTVLFSRRVAGELSPNTVWPSVVVSTLVATLSLTAWGLFHRVRSSVTDLRRDWLIAALAWLPTWLSGLAVAPVNSPFAQGWLIGIALLAGGVLAVFAQWHVEPAWSGELAAARIAPRESEPRSDSVTLGTSFGVFDPHVDEDADGLITQRMTRQTLPDGTEELEGSVRVLFSAGQRTASVHVPFSPPFAAVPQVECELVSDEEARWKVSVVYPYGMRIELKRSGGQADAELDLNYSAICTRSQSDAA